MPTKCIVCKLKVANFNEPGQKGGLYCKADKTPTAVDVVNAKCIVCMVKQPCFNFEGLTAQYCADDAEPGMVNVKAKRCKYPECPTTPAYNYPDQKGGLYCVTHAKEGMVDIYNPKCPECGVTANYNFSGAKKGVFCAEHRKEGMVDVKNIKCEHPQCTKVPNFSYPGQPTARFCYEHKEASMVNIHRDVCEQCDVTACFNLPGQTKGVRCAAHKDADMVDVKNKKCAHPGCTKQPNFNVPGKLSGAYCAEHKGEGMEQVTGPTCAFTGCTTTPVFHWEGQTKGKFCSQHKEDGMVNVRARHCAYPHCIRQPTFNKPGESSGIFCSEHAPSDYVNIYAITCAQVGCKKTASWNVPGAQKPTHCAEHAQSGMENIVSRRCQVCDRFPSYGLPGTTSTHCLAHKQVDMVPRPRKYCVEKDCREPALYGVLGTGVLHCEKHQQRDEVNLVERPCLECKLLFPLNQDGKCSYCDPTAVKGIKAKELCVKAWLDTEKLVYLSHDQMVDRGECVRYRPDFVFDAGTHVVILEVDEHQHRHYACDCEQTRMVNLSQAFDGRPVLFLRYNPDAYEDGNGKKCQPREGMRRKEVLLRVRQALAQPPRSLCEVLYLYYDGFTGAAESRHTVC